MIRHAMTVFALLVLMMGAGSLRSDTPPQDWTHFVRIGAYGLTPTNAAEIVSKAQASDVFGIEVDNDIEGRYESFVDPTVKLAAIQAVAQRAHAVGNKAFVYIAGTECITANADDTPHTLFKEHPDWVQRDINGKPALFQYGTAFWIRKGDEDVWVSPYAPEWRKIYMQHVRQIAATGIDGIYVDIPYWMTHFEGWEKTWASFDDYTVAAFKKQTGLDARHDLKLGDFSDPNFQKWVMFRIDTMTDFMREIRDNARQVNPNIMVIPEIYPGIEPESVRVGADVYQMYAVVDAIAHEYEFGEGGHMAAARSQLNWFLYQAGMLSFRAFAQGKATWILNYSWDGDKGVDPREAMKNLAMSQIMDGANFWDAPGHSMAGSNDLPTRKLIFQWIARYQNVFYHPRVPMHPVGVYFSPQSRDFHADDFLADYRGLLVLLLQRHIELQVVTPRTLADYHGESLVLPNVSILDVTEKSELQKYVSGGGLLVTTGADVTGIEESARVRHWNGTPGKDHLAALEKNFEEGSKDNPADFLALISPHSEITLEGSPAMAANFASVDGTPHIFIANFAGLIPDKVAVPTPQSGVRVEVPTAGNRTLKFLPYLGATQNLRGTVQGGKLVFTLPEFDRGAVVWVDDSK